MQVIDKARLYAHAIERQSEQNATGMIPKRQTLTAWYCPVDASGPSQASQRGLDLDDAQ